MRPFDFLLVCLVCLAWAVNFSVAAWALGTNDAKPFALAALRALFVLLVFGGFLFKPKSKNFARLLIVCFLMGPVHLGFLYTGLQTAPASGSAIVSQMLIPFATVLSVILLRERIGLVRVLAIIGALCGAVVMLYDPAGFTFNGGLFYIILAYFSAALASVLIKTVGDVDWRIYVTWMAALVLPLMGGLSFAFERQNWGLMLQSSAIPWAIAAFYGAIAVTIFAHGQYFGLLQRYRVNTIVPLTLMTPVMGAFIGVLFLREPVTLQLWLGALIILPCVALIVLRSGDKAKDREVIYGAIEK